MKNLTSFTNYLAQVKIYKKLTHAENIINSGAFNYNSIISAKFSVLITSQT